MVIFLWIVLSCVCASIGTDREIGGVPAFFISILLSPIIGFIVVLSSNKKKPPEAPKWIALIEQAEIENYKQNKSIAIDKYKEALYWLDKAHSQSSKERAMKLYDRMNEIKVLIAKIEGS